jgi:hypothetical protein
LNAAFTLHRRYRRVHVLRHDIAAVQ